MKQNYRYLRNYKQPALCGLFVYARILPRMSCPISLPP
nr:MAG TPA: hypothetical protein [Caudoviricetes sp.]